MQYDIFPSDYEKEVKKENETKLHKIKEVNCIEWLKKGLICGFVLGFIIGCTVADKADSISTGFIIYLIVIIVSVLAGWGFGKYQEERRKVRIDSIEEQANQKKQEYKEEFENEVEKFSMRFLENPATKKIINLLWNNLSNEISNADRRSFDKEVSVPFRFSVFCDKIDWGCGCVDGKFFYFANNNCENLKGPLEQTALSWAIAIGLKNEIMQKFSIDPSGTKSNVDIRRSSYNEAARIEITYTATNGYYQEPKPW